VSHVVGRCQPPPSSRLCVRGDRGACLTRATSQPATPTPSSSFWCPISKLLRASSTPPVPCLYAPAALTATDLPRPSRAADHSPHPPVPRRVWKPCFSFFCCVQDGRDAGTRRGGQPLAVLAPLSVTRASASAPSSAASGILLHSLSSRRLFFSFTPGKLPGPYLHMPPPALLLLDLFVRFFSLVAVARTLLCPPLPLPVYISLLCTG